jgi:hypothetical protein
VPGTTDDRNALDVIRASLPNGFHDALLQSLKIDVETGGLQLVLKPDMSLEAGDRWDPAYRKALLSLTGVDSLQMGSISLDGRDVSDRQVSLDIGRMSDRDVMQRFNRELESGQFGCCIFLNEMNASLYVIASGVSFTWLE